jgi:hypothetical protein
MKLLLETARFDGVALDFSLVSDCPPVTIFAISPAFSMALGSSSYRLRSPREDASHSVHPDLDYLNWNYCSQVCRNIPAAPAELNDPIRRPKPGLVGPYSPSAVPEY